MLQTSDTCASDMESIFSDAEPPPLSTPTPSGGRTRKSSVPEMVRALAVKERRSKRARAGSKEASPTDSSSHSCRLDDVSLAAMQKIMEAGVAKALQIMDAKYEALEKRTEILEAELMDKEAQITDLKSKLATNEKAVQEMAQQVESMDINRRMNTLILRCESLGTRTNEENIERKVIELLAERFPDIRISSQDIQTVHRLQGDHTVICKFTKTSLRNQLYERRMDTAGKRRAAPLYINESLTAANQSIFNLLLDVKRKGGIYTVFTRRGLVHIKTAFAERPRRVVTLDDAWKVTKSLTPNDTRERAEGAPAGGPSAGRPRGGGGGPRRERAGPGAGPPRLGGWGPAGRPRSDRPESAVDAVARDGLIDSARRDRLESSADSVRRDLTESSAGADRRVQTELSADSARRDQTEPSADSTQLDRPEAPSDIARPELPPLAAGGRADDSRVAVPATTSEQRPTPANTGDV